MKIGAFFTGGVIAGVLRSRKAYVPAGGPPASYSTAGPVTYSVADILSGIIVRDTNGAARTDVTPTAAQLVAGVPGVRVGDVLQCEIINGADAAEVITLTGGTGVTFDPNETAVARVIGQNSSKTLFIRFTNVTPGSEAAVAYL